MYYLIASNGNCTAILKKSDQYYYSRWPEKGMGLRPREEDLQQLTHERVTELLARPWFTQHDLPTPVERIELWPDIALEYQSDLLIPWSKVFTPDPEKWYIVGTLMGCAAYLKKEGKFYFSPLRDDTDVPTETSLREIPELEIHSADAKGRLIVHRPATPIKRLETWPQIGKEYMQRAFAEGRPVLG